MNKGDVRMYEAKYYEQLSDGRIHCLLCPHQCIVADQAYGRCKVRYNEGGTLIAKSYGFITSSSFDPVEKKPFYHFMPGQSIFSVGSKGCNFKCDFCQNARIALEEDAEGKEYTKEDLLEVMSQREDNVGIAFTYNEPMVGYEFMLDMAKAAKEKGYKTACVSNGYIMPDPLSELLNYIDAFNIDLKAFNDRFYHQICRGERAPVMEAIRRMANTNHVEVTTLIIEGENDDLEELENMFKWLKDISPNIPLHLSRYYPGRNYTKPATSISRLLEIETLAKKHLNFVYLGNVPDVDHNTYCPKCGTKVIERSEGQIKPLLESNACHVCKTKIPVVL